MNDLTLVIMAAGLGSRFGGLKQIEPVSSNGQFLIDYAIYDAIKKENYEDFQETIGKRIAQKVKIEYAFQENNYPFKLSEKWQNRTKPLGTTHAIICAKEKVHEPFVIINADDFYGRQAFMDAKKFLEETNYAKYGAILYKIENTLSENGQVKRGICQIKDNNLIGAIECSVGYENTKMIAYPLNKEENFEVENGTPTSMNMFIMLPKIFDLLTEKFQEFIDNEKNYEKAEALIIEDLFKLIKEDKLNIETRLTDSKWFGMTYKEDKNQVVKLLEQKTKEGLYPQDLWSD